MVFLHHPRIKPIFGFLHPITKLHLLFSMLNRFIFAQYNQPTFSFFSSTSTHIYCLFILINAIGLFSSSSIHICFLFFTSSNAQSFYLCPIQSTHIFFLLFYINPYLLSFKFINAICLHQSTFAFFFSLHPIQLNTHLAFFSSIHPILSIIHSAFFSSLHPIQSTRQVHFLSFLYQIQSNRHVSFFSSFLFFIQCNQKHILLSFLHRIQSHIFRSSLHPI